MANSPSKRASLGLIILGIAVAGALVGWWQADRRRDAILNGLMDDARRCAIAFDPAELRKLAGTASDEGTEVYRSVKDRLIRFQAVNPDVRFVYIFRHLPQEDKVIFLGDSAVPGAKDESKPGDVYKEAKESPGLQSIVADGHPSTEGPLADEFGTWVTGYALIGMPATGQPREILGFDLSASDWYMTLWTTGLTSAGYVWALISLPLVSLWLLRRERSQKAEMREARERAEAGDRAKGQFLATMSHEVRTPLNGIVGFAELLLESDLDSDQREYVNTMRASADTMVRLTGDILDFSKIEQGKLKLEPQDTALRELIEGTLDLLAAPSQAKNIELLHWIDPDVPPRIMVDAGRLRQVLVNLVNNAVKFTLEGSIAVDVRTIPENRAADGRVCIEVLVTDTGIGIPQEKQHLLFRPFSQVDGGSTRRFGGTGLGLVISRTIVQLMDGEISFTSTEGEGSKFKFTIRIPTSMPAVSSTPPSPLEGRRLAIVAKSQALENELSRLGTLWGATVVPADFPSLSTTVCDVAVVEPGEHVAGDMIASRLPKHGRCVAIVPLTSSASTREQLRRHFRALVNKPIHHDRLRQVLEESIAGRSAQDVGIEAQAPAKQSDWSLLRVLLVEDNVVNQRLMKEVLNKIGCHWGVADNGLRALEALKAGTFDVVLMDLQMPELDGIGATQKIRAGGAGAAARDVWIILLTADTRENLPITIEEIGANGFLSKPLQRAELLAALDDFRTTRSRTA